MDVDAAVAIVRTPGPDPTILLTRRAEREGDAWSGHWSLPGGRREDSDTDLLETALRELHEECGVQLSRGHVSAALSPTLARRRVGRFLLVAPFVFDVDTELPTIPDIDEVAETMWMPLRTLTDVAQHSLQRAPGLPSEMWFPAITLPGVPLWGFTYRLLLDWLDVCPRDCAIVPGFEVAEMILAFLLSQGLILEAPWQSQEQVSVAKVQGTIPVEAVVERFSPPGHHIPKINRVEVRPDYVRIYGLDFEEYLIEAS